MIKMDEPRAVAVLVSGGGTNLEALFEAEQAGTLKSGRIRLVISDRKGAGALDRAVRRGVRAVFLEKRGSGGGSTEDYSARNIKDYSGRLLALLREARIEVVVLAGFLTVLAEPLLGAYPRRIINIHPSLLPAFGGRGWYGLNVHRAVLDAGCTETGATAHFVDASIDGGEILVQKAVAVRPDDTPESLQRRVMEEAEWVILSQAVETVCAGLSAQPGLIGLTGLYCAGKNYAAALLEKHGIPVLDVDKAGHEALERQKTRIVEVFGADILDDHGLVDRKKLGKKVFDGDKRADRLRTLEEIVHPEVDRMTEDWIRAQNTKFCGINAALLHKCACFNRLGLIMVIRAPFPVRLWRALRRDRLPLADLLRRFRAQKEFRVHLQNAQLFSKNADTRIMVVDNFLTGLEAKLKKTGVI